MNHQALLQEKMSSLYQPYRQVVDGTSGYLDQSFGKHNGAVPAMASVYGELNRQAAMQGYVDVFKMLFWMAVGMILLAFLLNKNKPASGKSDIAMH